MNITKATFGTDRTSTENSARTAPLWQYDYGQILLIEGIELPPAYEVHFANAKHGNSVTMLGNDEGVAIPDALLLKGEPVYAWVYLHTGNDDGETEYIVTIPVNKRAKPTNDTPTPVQQDIIEQAIAALENAMEECQDAVEHYPKIEDGYWYVWDVEAGEFVNTGIDARGLKGDTGTVFIPDVSVNGVISWTNDGGLPNPDPVDITNAVHLDEYARIEDLATKIDVVEKGVANGVAELDDAGKVPSSQLPAYVDDVLEFASVSQFPAVGEAGKIYVSTSNNTTYRWSGSQYVGIGGSLTLGETSTTAYRGDRGRYAYEHAANKGGAFSLGLYKVRTNAEGHVTAVQAVTASDIPGLNNKADKADTILDTYLSRGRKANTTIGSASYAFGVDVIASGSCAHAEGAYTNASGPSSHTEGAQTYAEGTSAHAEGGSTIARGTCSHAEGGTTTASGNYSHAEGQTTTASAVASHAEGASTTASGYNTHAEGGGTIASGNQAHAEGGSTVASGINAHAEGGSTTASGNNAHAEGIGGQFTINDVTYTSGAHGTADHSEGYQTMAAGGEQTQSGNHAEGYKTRATGGAAHAEGDGTFASGNKAHAEGFNTIASGAESHAEGAITTASGNNAHAEGSNTTASAANSHAEGSGTLASEQCAHSEGNGTQATGNGAHSEGGGTRATGGQSHAEGGGSIASGACSHAEGGGTQATALSAHSEGGATVASGSVAHSEGSSTIASGNMSHAEGEHSQATGGVAHAEGNYTVASGSCSHAEGSYTTAAGAYSHVSGMGNVADSYANWPEWVANTEYEIGDKVKRTTTVNGVTTVAGFICKTANSDASFTASKWNAQNGKMNFAEIVGNGSGDVVLSNARALDWDGNEYLKGDVYVGCNGDSTGGSKLAKVSELPDISGKVDKSALDNAGITDKTYTTKFGGEFSVTTVADQDHLSPYARASVTGRIYKEYAYKVTFNGTEYILPQRMWFETNGFNFKVYEYLGNLNLYISDTSGVSDGTDNVPFIIISDLNSQSSIDILTQAAGTYTIKVEQINITKTQLPKTLIYGDEYQPIEKAENATSAFNGFSVGINEIKNKRGTVAIGYTNSINNEFSAAIGICNKVSGRRSYAIGSENVLSGIASMAIGVGATVSGDYAFAENISNVATGSASHAEGQTTLSSGNSSHSEGRDSVASGNYSHAQNRETIANGLAMTAIGRQNIGSTDYQTWVANTSYVVGDKVVNGTWGYRCKTANNDSTFDSSKWDKLPSTCDTSFVIGNGIADDARSNALKVDWDGNARLMGDVYVGCNTDSTGGTKLATVDDISPVVSVSGTTPSITGVANTRYVCGEVSTLSITPPQTGCIDVLFTSGSTATVLTVPNTVKWPSWFDPTDLASNCTYEINILDGVYGAVSIWA